MDDNYVLKEGSPTSPMLDEHSTATIIEKTVDVSDIGEFIIGESNSSIITFRMNRYYDGVDLLEKTIKVMYRNSNGIFESDVVNIKYTSNSLKFSWIVPHDATTSKKLLAYVCFVSDGYLWKTKTFTITVDQSFDVGDSEPTQNWFVNIESKLTKIEKTIDEAVGKLSKQIPTKVSDLENDLAVSYSAQELTSEQKQQVRENINIGVSKKVVTYNGAKRSFTVGVIEGTIADLPEDSASEYLEAYKNFWHVCEYMRIFKLTTWQFAKNALKWLSSAHKNNIISDSLTFYVTKPSKYIKYSYNVNTQGRAYDLMEYYDEGATLKLSYYPDTDEFEDNQMDAKWSKPITMNSYGLDNNTPLVEQFELSKNPISDMEVATKEYVDNNTMSVVQGRDCPESLDTMTDTGYCYIQSYSNPYPSDFPDIADKTKDSVLICYRETARGCARQILYNGNDKVFTRYGNPEMCCILWNDWTDLTSSPIMYIHVTSEEKDGETVYKSDKTFEEIKEAIDSGKSPVVIYNNVLFNLYEGGNTKTTFVGDNNGIFIYDKDDGILFIPKSNMIQVDITVQDTGETVIACNDKNIVMSFQAMQIYQTGIMFIANVNKNNKQYNLILQLVGGEHPTWSTITTVGDKLMRCTLCIGDPSNTSTWEYTETEIISNNSVTIPNIYTTITRNDNGTYTSSLTFDDIKSKITDQYQVYAIYTVDNTEYILNLEEVSQYVCVFRNESYEIQILQNRCKVYNFITPLTCQLTYKADKTEELIMDDRLKYCSQAYTYLRSCRTVNMSINKEGSDETIKTILQVQSVDITGGTLIGQVLVNNDVYFYKLGLESGINDASWWTLTTKKLSDNFTPLKTQVTT